MPMKTLILTDNSRSLELAREVNRLYGQTDIFQSPHGLLGDVPRLSVRDQIDEIVTQYNPVLSIHCKQLFPADLVRAVRCVNVHPGFSPYNRGWFPHVFSIINGLTAGVTIHEMDEQIDHGPIIVQQEYEIKFWDTSGTTYEEILRIERELVLQHFPAIREGSYRALACRTEGNINYRKDFDQLRRLDLEQSGRFGDFLNRLRALTHDGFQNAYFVDDSGRKVFLQVVLEPEERA